MKKFLCSLLIVALLFLLACQPAKQVTGVPPAAPATPAAEEINASQDVQELDELDTLVEETEEDLGLEELEKFELE